MSTINPEDQTVKGDCTNWSKESLLETYVYDSQPKFKPDESSDSWSYSNTNYLLLGLIIEAVTGKSLESVYFENIFKPLHMRQTHFKCIEASDFDLAHGYAKGYQKDDASQIVDVTQKELRAWSDGGLISTAADLIHFIRALFTNQLFSRAETLELMLAQPTSHPYGLGILKISANTYGHGGVIDGYISKLSYDHENDTAIIVFHNASYSNLQLIDADLRRINALLANGE